MAGVALELSPHEASNRSGLGELGAIESHDSEVRLDRPGFEDPKT